MKLNKKVKRAGLISGILLIGLIGVGKVLDIPVLSTGVNYVLYPFEKGINLITNGTSNIFERFQNVNDLIAENEALQKEVSQLRYEKTILSQYQDENDNLRTLLDMKKRYADYEGIGANVIGRDYGNWNKVYTIDKGLRNNVKDNSVILANGGLVGHVEQATDIASKAIAIIDSRSAVSAEVSRTGDVGILKGNIELANDGLCILEINGESEIMKGDQIITSYLSDIYPPGILIGTVEQVLVNNNDLVSYAYVKPIVDFDHLQQVLVINTKSE